MRKKRQVGLFKAIGHAVALAQVDQRQRTFVVAEQHRCLPAAVLRLRKQPLNLFLAPGDGAYLYRALRPLGGAQRFGAAVAAAGHKGVGCGYDLLAGAIVLFHQQDACAGVDLLKIHQRLRVGRAEAVDALVFVTDHEQVQAAPRQQPNDLVLNFRGVLRFIHAEIPVPLLEIPQHRRRGAQNLQRKHHLVVVVHLPGAFQRGLVAAVQLRQVRQVGVHGLDLRVGQRHIFDVGDGGAQLFQRAFGRKFAVYLLPDIAQQPGNIALVRQKLGLAAAVRAAVILQNHRRKPVDGAECHLCCQLIPEPRGKPAAHLVRGSHRVGHCQNLRGGHMAAQHHVAQPRDQHGGFAAARHGQQQHRAVHGLHGGQLLGVQPGGVLLYKGILLQSAASFIGPGGAADRPRRRSRAPAGENSSPAARQ